MSDVVLGPAAGFTAFPAEVEIGRNSYFLTKDKGTGEYRLLSRICPHAGYLVEEDNGELFCPIHGWTFDADSGKCLNVSMQKLTAYEVVDRDGELVAVLPG